MPPDTDWTTELPPVDAPSCQPGSSWQQLAEPRDLAAAWRRANLYGTYAIWTGAVLTAGWLLLVICWALWNAR